MAESFALATWYLLSSTAVLLAAMGIGALFLRSRGSVFEKYTLGLCVISLLVVVLGLLQALYTWVLIPLLLVLAVAGWVRNGDSLPGLPSLPHLRWPQKTALLATAFVLLLLAVNVLIGGLAPDTSQDSFWYHLSLPEQWILRHNVAMFSHVMPSSYTLAADALYVPLLMVSNAILASCLYAQVILVLFAYIIHIGFRTGGFWGGLGVAVLFPLLLGMSMAIAPIYALNDATTALFLLAGAWQFWRPMQEHRVPDTREWILSGVFLASAVAAKIVVILFAGPLVLFVILSLLMRHGWRQTVRPLIIFLLVAVLCYLPWLIRGFIYAGNPLIHLFQDLLPVREEFEPVLRGYRREPRTFPFDADGLREAFTRGLWFKAYSAAQLRDALFFIVPLAGLAGAVARSHPLRSTGFAIIAAWLVLPFLHGYNELLRYYTICYVLAVPLLAIWFCAVAGRVRHDVMALVILVLLAASTYNYASRQLAWAGMRTVNWNFRPVLTESHRMEWTRHVENGSTYRLYHKLQPIIDEDALVLVADAPGVAYLRRRALWADYSCGNLIEDWWNGISAQEMHAGLRERGVDFVVYTLSLHNDPRFPEMESAGLVERVPIDEPGATLWRVVSGSE